jgi:hypothetical protein
MPKNQSSAVISKSQLSFLRARLKMKGSNRFNPRHASMAVVANLHQPMAAALAEENKNARSVVIDAIYQHIVRTGKFYGSWTRKQWVNCYRMALPRYKIERATQTFVFAAYKLAGLVLSKEICSGRHRISLVHLCRKLYGEQVDLEMARLIAALLSTGYAERGVVVQLPAAIAELMLWLEEPELDKWRDPIIRAREIMRPNFQGRLHAISVGLNVLGIVKEPIAFRAAIGFSPNVHYKPKTGIGPDPVW